jgi:opacity protein-like surface antigen
MTRGVRASAAAIALGAVLAGALAPAPAAAQTKTGTTIGAFLLIEPSARVTGMGNAGVTLDAGLQSVYYNPAAIGQIDRYALMFSHGEWLADIDYNYAAAALPVRKLGTLFASVTALTSGDIAVRTVEQPLGTGEYYDATDVAIGVGWGTRISDRFSAGFQASYVQETIWHSSASTAVFGLGTIYRVAENGLHIGASIANYGTGAGFDGRDLRITYDQDPDRYGDNGALPGEVYTEKYPVPVLFRIGVGLPYRLNEKSELRVAVDAFHPSDNSESVSLGAEYAYKKLFALRGGYQNLFQKDSEVGLTLGAGLQGDLSETLGYNLDYAWADHGRLDSTHRLTVGITF